MRRIAGDSLEHSRIRLERDIDKHIPPPPSMSFDFAAPHDDEDEDDVSSVDFPRHISRHQSFHSFEHASHLDSDFYPHHDDEASMRLDVDLGRTMSTAAHHASALTLSAGLRGRGAAYSPSSGTASLPGAEYDPERPLQAILANRIAAGLSLFDNTSRSKSQNQARTAPSFDPVVVDSTADLDRFLRTGHDRPARLVYPYTSRSHSQPASSVSDREADAPPARLAHALAHDFSPKRPRRAASPTKRRPSNSHLKSSAPPPAAPKPAPAAKDDADRTPRPPRRAPFSELANKHTARVHLPDVTGLTSAVQSPARADAAYAPAPAPAPRTPDLLPALDALQARLQALERANSVSRRRVHELEHELEACRGEVLAERTRLEAHRRPRAPADDSRYHTAVAEKKALEALLASLRTHLTRLTAELASHKTLVASLREGRRDAGADIAALRAEVERLAGEVERLKAIVEDGLRERRRARDESVQEEMPAQVGIDLTYVVPPLPGRAEPRAPPEPAEEEHMDQPLQEEGEEEYEPVAYHQTASDVSERAPTPAAAGPARTLTPSFIPAAELAHVAAEMHARRAERSRSRSDGSAGQRSRDDDSGNGSSLRDALPSPAGDKENRAPSPENNPPRSREHSARPPGRETHPPPPPPLHAQERSTQRTREDAHPRTPFPQIRGSRMERLFFSAPAHNARTCSVCDRRKSHRAREARREMHSDEEELVRAYLRKRERARGLAGDGGDAQRPPPPQTVLVRVVRELEDDFSHYKAIYLELAEQYGAMDAASNVAKRNVLAAHLREVVDVLEQKGDQIAALYALLRFEDRPLARAGASDARGAG